MIFSSKEINSIIDLLLIGILKLQNKHIPELLFPSKKIIFCWSISIFYTIYGQFLNAFWTPKVNIFEMENRLWPNYFSVVYMWSDRVRIRNTIDVMRMIAPQFWYYRGEWWMIQVLYILTLMVRGNYFWIVWMLRKTKHECCTFLR